MSSLYLYVLIFMFLKGMNPTTRSFLNSILNLLFINGLVCLESSLCGILAFLCHSLGTDFKSGNLNVNYYDQSENTL